MSQSPAPTEENYVYKNLRYNVMIGLLDGAFFGLAIGFATFSTFIPLFVKRLTDSAIWIGLVPAVHNLGWQLPQLFTAGWVAKQRRLKPLVLLMTIQERIPFFGMALVAWFLPGLGKEWALALTFLLLAWQGLGGGFTANAWQSMIAKIIPNEYRGTFFGSQAAAANALISLGSIAGGFLLASVSDDRDFSYLFLLTTFFMVISWIFLSRTREQSSPPPPVDAPQFNMWQSARDILRRDTNFARFLVVRLLMTFATTTFVFFVVQGVRRFDMDDITAGFLTAALTLASTVANPLMGWLGDRYGHRNMIFIGALASAASIVLVWAAPSLSWFYPAYILQAIANVAYWTIGMSMVVQFGQEHERPMYIGLFNTLIAPVSILAPIFGGWLADAAGLGFTFALGTILSVLTALALAFLVKDPRHLPAVVEKG